MDPSPISRLLRDIHTRHRENPAGTVASYIPELTKANPDWFGVCVATRDGHVYEVGDTRQKFTIQSISKALVYGLALEDRGEEEILRRIGVEPSGDVFNAISLRPGTGQPLNPMINAGAIASAGLVLERDGESRIARIVQYLSRCAGRTLDIDEDVYASESRTGHRNRAIGWMLRHAGVLEDDPQETLETYFRQCSVRVTCRDLALIGATLANHGRNPITRERAIQEPSVDNILSVMATCGMYDATGEWVYRVGLPAKSGVGGGILAVLPGQLGIGVFSPKLDAQGNSVRGVLACIDLARELNLHLFNPSAAPQPSIRRTYDGSQVTSRRRRPPAAAAALRKYGSRIRVLELQGELLFSTVEPAIRAVFRHAPYTRHIVLDLRNVVRADTVSLRLLAGTRESLRVLEPSVRLAFCRCAGMERELRGFGVADGDIHADSDAALERSEDLLLAEVLGERAFTQEGEGLARCPLFDGCSADELAWLDRRLGTSSFHAGQRILEAGAPADELYVIARGAVEVRVGAEISAPGSRVDVFTDGMTFGEMAFLDGAPRSADVIALEPTVCRVFDRALFERIDTERPELKIRLLTRIARLLSAHLRHMNAELNALRD